MSVLREAARGQDCLARIPGACNGDPETVVLHHVRLSSGMGAKPSDLFGAWVCSGCHQFIHNNPRFARAMELEAMYRTQLELLREGLIVVPD